MIWQIFSLYPQIFESFLKTSLVARAIDKKILEFELINWRNFGTGNYKQVDDRPTGGGSGMVLQVEPITKALVLHNSLSDFGKMQLSKLEDKVINPETRNISDQSNDKNQSINLNPNKIENNTFLQINSLIKNSKRNHKVNCQTLSDILPNNSKFYNWVEKQKKYQENQLEILKNKNLGQEIIVNLTHKIKIKEEIEQKNKNLANTTKKATILLTPRGFPLDQKICHWLSEFDQVSLICGRFEGFDYRLNQVVDLEISIGEFVCNGGEIPAMCLIEAISRLIPGFITKPSSHLHDSFSDQNNEYLEQKEFVIGKKKLQEFEEDYDNLQRIKNQLLQNLDDNLNDSSSDN